MRSEKELLAALEAGDLPANGVLFRYILEEDNKGSICVHSQ